MTTLRIGIASYEEMKARTLAIAGGEYKPKKGEPKVWFTSMESVAKVLSDKNRALLSLIATEQPTSLTELAKLSGRAKPNLSRTLKTMAGYGLVQLKKGASGKMMPVVPYSEIVLDLFLSESVAKAKG
jgi:predicted transcriptional regulator